MLLSGSEEYGLVLADFFRDLMDIPEAYGARGTRLYTGGGGALLDAMQAEVTFFNHIQIRIDLRGTEGTCR